MDHFSYEVVLELKAASFIPWWPC